MTLDRHFLVRGQGGVFGTTGGGTDDRGMHVVERPVIEGTERGEDEVTPRAKDRGPRESSR